MQGIWDRGVRAFGVGEGMEVMEDLIIVKRGDLEGMIRGVIREELDSREQTGEILTKSDVAKEYGWSPSTINRYMKDGMPHFGPGRPRFRRSDINLWLEKKQSYL
jgi:predicted DNA-binding transcriptional regulator AlpA